MADGESLVNSKIVVLKPPFLAKIDIFPELSIWQVPSQGLTKTELGLAILLNN